MPLVPKSRPSIEPIPADTYQAVCYAVVDLGTHLNEKWKTEQQKILIAWEIPSVRYKYERDGTQFDEARVIAKKYTFSYAENAYLFKDLTNWRGKPFTEDEIKSFDIFKVLKQNCMLQIIHTENNQKTYANVSGVVKLPAGMKLIEPEHTVIQYSMQENEGDLSGLPEWVGGFKVKDIIAESIEFKGDPAPQNTDSDLAPTEDDIPF